ncbi:hypothetical protein Tco_0386806, partial [Tanacetum coccineum]
MRINVWSYVPGTGWPSTRFVFSCVLFPMGNRNCQQSPGNDDPENRVDHSGECFGGAQVEFLEVHRLKDGQVSVKAFNVKIFKDVEPLVNYYLTEEFTFTRKAEIPESLGKRYRNKFFWGFKEGEKGMVWISWKRVIGSRDLGGLGISSLRAKNLSLLGKWRWRFLKEKDALWRK